MEKIIEIADLTFHYPQQDSELLRQVNLTIHKGEWVALIGHNGSGKSTLARLIDGLLVPTTGTLKIGGTILSDASVWQIRKKIGMVFQNPDNQFVGANVEEDVAFGLENLAIPRAQMQVRVKEALQRVNMWEFREHEPARLSGGQKQRVALAGVIAMRPEIIILDEATSMLDPEGRKDVIKIIQELSQAGFTIISITHDINEASLAQRVVVLNDGQILQDATPQTVFARGEKLLAVGLDVPFSEKLKVALSRQGLHVPAGYLTEEGMIDWLCQSISKT
ncbi:energy-coupling factor ABC transporter ATP-binding protein [Liquorilactobacillus satsumensis]|uniref:energy-coupling factor ABC transporter ATP-binding protein n=1 Tax=Liquorilactobacillus satsumensis TaxID=259059 RepID=UPI001E2E19B5|nr:energy-coupling factor ABC transporter ATP-binding protein [Liquorilactobacillus satsumensis]MCC7667618.1 energy-coupling factor transporter ATPase [Liquorilactobacillus satsumensis]MCP9313180.1 energy-coupling factor ABC transporter ATP-binding protein [Liquorilactobacillus satsumensis]MCP9357908.1 energy-coupling factor ABC transporter ATP-binding protein [Liquorilactobacillus satsumensis]MCP9360285.1 energy-coupling factor ABC transporter ATP-binding protein [Liquorilactobacillus satsumen